MIACLDVFDLDIFCFIKNISIFWLIPVQYIYFSIFVRVIYENKKRNVEKPSVTLPFLFAELDAIIIWYIDNTNIAIGPNHFKAYFIGVKANTNNKDIML
jgi:hypothetical protein